MKFTFKKVPRTGKYRSFQPKFTDIKLKGKKCGSIFENGNGGFVIILMVVKKDIMEDGNPNCIFRNQKFGKRFESEQPAKEWLNEHITAIQAAYTLHFTD